MKLIQQLVLFLALLIFKPVISQTNLAAYVNPFIGTGGHGHTFPGAVMPFGMVQLSPDTRVDGSWDGCSGYHYVDNLIYGFSHTHLSGTGCSDWGDVLLMPLLGAPSMNNAEYASSFTHKNEHAGAGFYEVLLNKHHIKAELTVTPRVGIHRYTFPKTQEAEVILDLLHRDKTLNCTVAQRDSFTITGFRTSEAWARKQTVYFAIRFSKAIKTMQLANNKKLVAANDKNISRAEGACFYFNVKDKQPLMVKVSISSVSAEGALKNMEAEATHWDFDKYKKDAEAAWNKQLQKITVNDKDKTKLTTFYTALYHCSIHPSLYMDVDRQYRGRDGFVHRAEGFTNYTVFSLWDTYRALNPLFTIIEKQRTRDFINSFISQFKQTGRLPMWELSGNETDCMIGYHSVSVIADAMVKGIRGFDTTLAYAAMKAASGYSAYSIPVFNQNGFLQVDDESESVSKSLEYAYDDWCIAQMARYMQLSEDVALYEKRSLAYKNLFDASTGFMRPRKNGDWLKPFHPAEVNNYFTEGNSWQYSFYVPHDLEGLIALHGGSQNFEHKLDELFTTQEKLSGRDQSDVTGLIGQYAHGNEPSHHMAYLYNFVGQPQKTIARTHQVCNDFYKNTPDGLIGNEDCGQMSAWYVFNVMGLYPVCPGSSQYSLSEPLFSSITLQPEEGKAFTIVAKNIGHPVSGVSLNGVTSLHSFIDHRAIVNGGKLEFLYSGNAADYGKDQQDHAGSHVNQTIVPTPVISAPSRVFKTSMPVTIEPVNSGAVNCFYTTDGSEPSRTSGAYTQPFEVDSNCTVKAKAFSTGDESHAATAHYFKLKYNYDIHISSQANPQYAADGSQTLIDGISGDTEWRKGNWLGYQGQDFECVVDLKHMTEIHQVSLDALQDTRAWIILPAKVEIFGSEDNKNFTQLAGLDNPVNAADYQKQTHLFEIKFSQPVKAHYIKIVAKNFGKLPEWHEGKGGQAFIFVDELKID